VPFSVRKSPGGGYDILKSGKKIGHSATKKKAKISVSIRERESGDRSRSIRMG